MELLQETHGSTSHVALVGEVNIYDAMTLKQQLLDALYGHKELIISLADVTEIDSTAIQLLMLLKRESLRLHKILHLVDHSPATMEVIDVYNLAEYFGDPLVISAVG